jgi:hypothetical protein
MHPPLSEWDAAYITTLLTPDETVELEKKESTIFDPVGNKKALREELAKQVCAFSNAGDGFIVFGIDKTGKLDAGVAGKVGGQPVKAWLEAEIPRLLNPSVTSCEAKLIHMPAHAPDKGVVVIYVPLSFHRPHWLPGPTHGHPGLPYIRAGEHSVCMTLQTFLDMSSRGDVPQAVIDSLGFVEGPNTAAGGRVNYRINPKVRLVTGPVCKDWGFELKIDTSIGRITAHQPVGTTNFTIAHDYSVLFALGHQPLFAGRSTEVATGNFFLEFSAAEHCVATARLFAGAAQPVTREFSLKDFHTNPSAF